MDIFKRFIVGIIVLSCCAFIAFSIIYLDLILLWFHILLAFCIICLIYAIGYLIKG
jgi:hypothetical protein